MIMDFSTQVLDGDDRHAVLLPGGGYPATAPLLWYTAAALSFQGWTVHLVSWPSDVSRNVVVPIATELLDSIDGASATLLAGKSLGSLAMPLAAERGIPGIWLTPLLYEPRIADTARRLGEDHLLIGGTADPAWDSAVAMAGTAQLLEVPNADHALQIEGDLEATLAAITAAARAVAAFARGLR
ncbi:MAG: hypothetical protein J2P23_12655 [Microlunatus sp.]|nr:hypothetical protein [Microlunatus sp.]